MKTYGFNLLPQKPRSLVKKEDKRDNYSVSVALLPFLSVVIWLAVVLTNNLVIETYRSSWENSVNESKQTINVALAPILVQHGELVAKTNSLSNVILNDIKPEQLFILLDQIYQSDPTFTINGYGRNGDGTFYVSLIAKDYQRLSEVARKFTSYKYIEDVVITNASYDDLGKNVSGQIQFLFNYVEIEADNDTK